MSNRAIQNRNQAGRALGSVLLLLLIVAGAGGWNYHRNWEIEKQTEGTRPYKGYAEADLESLRAAYGGDLDQKRSQFDQAKRQRTRPKRDQGSIANNVDQFARTARTSAAIRQAAGDVAAGQGQLAELDREIELRTRFGKGMERHIKRLITF